MGKSQASKLADQANEANTDPKAERWTEAQFFELLDGVLAKDATIEQGEQYIKKVGGTAKLTRRQCLGLAKVFKISMPSTATNGVADLQKRIQKFLDGEECKYIFKIYSLYALHKANNSRARALSRRSRPYMGH